MEEKELIEKIGINVIQGRVEAEDEGFDEGFEGQPGTTELVEMAVEQEIDAARVVLDGLTGPMEEVGKKFEAGTYLIPDMLASAECVGGAMDILAPHLGESGVQSKGTFVLATVKGDLHDIGKNIVSIMLKGAGFDVVDLGTDVSATRIADAVADAAAPYLGLSALLTTTMRNMEAVIAALREKNIRQQVKVLVGGAPTSAEFAERIGADAYCKDAFQAIETVKALG